MATPDYLSTRALDRPATMRGAAAILSALNEIGGGHDGDGDQRLAKHIVESELDVRALLTFAQAHLASEPD